MRTGNASHPGGAFAWLLLCQLYLVSLFGFSQEPSDPVLALATPVRGTLAWGEREFWALPLDAGTYFHLRVTQQEVDLAVSILSPAGNLVHRWDNDLGARSLEEVYGLSEEGGIYRLELFAPEKDLPPGSFEMELLELRPAKAEDGWRVKAETAFSLALQRHAAGSKEDLLEAIVHYEASLPWWQKLKKVEGEATTLNNLGRAKELLGDREKAIELFQAAIELWQTTDNAAGWGRSLNNMGDVLVSIGQPEEALRYFEKALQKRKEAGDEVGIAGTLNNMGTAYARLGQFRKCLDYFHKVVPLFPKLHDGNLKANVLANLGFVHNILGENQKALDFYRQALPIQEALGNKRGQANILNNAAMVYRLFGQPEKAIPMLEQALELFRVTGAQRGEATVLQNLGQCALFMEDYSVAEAHFQMALSVFETIKEEAGIAGTRLNLGVALLRKGDQAAARPLLEAALKSYQTSGNRHGISRSMNAVASAHLAAGNRSEAVSLATQSLELAQAIGEENGIAESHFTLARCAESGGDDRAVIHHLTQALPHLETVRGNVGSQDLRASFLASNRNYYELLLATQVRLAQTTRNEGLLHAALATSERARARSLFELIREAALDFRTGVDPALIARETDLNDQLSLLQRKLGDLQTGSDQNQEEISAVKHELERILNLREAWLGELRRNNLKYAQLRYPQAFEVSRLQTLIQADTGVLEFFVGKERAWVFVIRKDRLSVVDLGSSRDLDHDITGFRAALSKPGTRSFAKLRLQSQQVYQRVLEPVRFAIDGLENLVIIPDGNLFYLPFESIIVGERSGNSSQTAPDYALFHWNISYVPSLNIWAQLKNNRARQSPNWDFQYVAFADPAYSTEQKPMDQLPDEKRPWPESPMPTQRLPHSHWEATQCASFYPKEKVALFLEGEASEYRVRHSRELSNTRYLHFGAHGLLNEEAPLLSGLVLASGGPDAHDGLLQAFEIFNLKMNPDLVILSACETGLGKAVSGEGLVGLSRAFFNAGANCLAASLWQVADRSTAELMVAFHKGLQAGKSKPLALKDAKIELIASKTWQHPYHWAPFILMGNPDGPPAP